MFFRSEFSKKIFIFPFFTSWMGWRLGRRKMQGLKIKMWAGFLSCKKVINHTGKSGNIKPLPPSQANAWRIKYIRTGFSKLHICTVSSYDICKIWYLTESIERFIEDQVCLRSYYYSPRHPLPPTHAESCGRKTVWTSINHSILSICT
jgi:hypothetical protein